MNIEPASRLVNKIGKYLYKNIDGAFKYRVASNQYDVYFTLLYQVPYWDRIPGRGNEYNDVHEITVDINITTYQNKIRVNTIEVTPQARTLGFDLIKPERLVDLEEAKKLILHKVVNRVQKAYTEYDILF